MAEESGDNKSTADGVKEEAAKKSPSQEDVDKAEGLKAQANQFFKDEKYQQAADLYSEVTLILPRLSFIDFAPF